MKEELKQVDQALAQAQKVMQLRCNILLKFNSTAIAACFFAYCCSCCWVVVQSSGCCCSCWWWTSLLRLFQLAQNYIWISRYRPLVLFLWYIGTQGIHSFIHLSQIFQLYFNCALKEFNYKEVNIKDRKWQLKNREQQLEKHLKNFAVYIQVAFKAVTI